MAFVHAYCDIAHAAEIKVQRRARQPGAAITVDNGLMTLFLTPEATIALRDQLSAMIEEPAANVVRLPEGRAARRPSTDGAA